MPTMVQVVEREDGRIAAIIEVAFAGTEADIIDAAWRAAVDDKSVEPDRRKAYVFRLVPKKAPSAPERWE